MQAREERKLAVLVPHQDDELNIAGQVLPYFTESGWQVKVCFSTNGDMRVYEGETRYDEAVKAAEIMGLCEDDLVWLGYPDCKTSQHLYHDSFQDLENPERMRTKCYGPALTLTKMLAGEEKPVCRASLLEDIGLFLRWYRPEVIIAIDCDSHPDHRALSLLFEEALSQLLCEDSSYRPVVLKKFAYAGCWYGPDDYYSFAATRNIGDDSRGETTCNPTLRWGERLCFKPHPSSLSPKLRDNVVYQAAKAYKTQVPWPNMARVCNGDAVYWQLRTDNLLYGARIEASSGDVSALLDLRRLGLSDIAAPLDQPYLLPMGWIPDTNDAAPMLEVVFDEPKRIRTVELEASVCNEGAMSLEYRFDDGGWHSVAVCPGEKIHLDGFGEVLASAVHIRIESNSSCPGCIASLAMFEEDPVLPSIPLAGNEVLRSSKSPSSSKPCRLIQKTYFHLLKKMKLIRRLLSGLRS